MKYIVVDLEMNPIAKKHADKVAICKNEIIEIGAVLLDENFQEISSFMTYVRPEYNLEIVKKIEKLTGISWQMVENAPPFAEAFEMFSAYCRSIKGEYEICEWSDSDRVQFEKEIELKDYVLDSFEEELMGRFVDFQKEFGDELGLERQVSLKNALYYIGIDFKGRAHDALFDARNTAELLTVTRVEERRKVVMDKIVEILHPTELTSSLGDLIDFSSFQLA